MKKKQTGFRGKVTVTLEGLADNQIMFAGVDTITIADKNDSHDDNQQHDQEHK